MKHLSVNSICATARAKTCLKFNAVPIGTRHQIKEPLGHIPS